MISLEEARKVSEGYKVVPISKEIMSDIRTPMQVLRILKGVSNGGTKNFKKRKLPLLHAGKCGKSGKMGQIYISWI